MSLRFRILAAPGCRDPKEFYITGERARKLMKGGKITPVGGDGKTFQVLPPGVLPPRIMRPTRISSGGPLAAAGMSQIYTLRNELGAVNAHKYISPEDKGAFLPYTDN